VVRDIVSTTTALGNIKVTARPSLDPASMLVQTYTNGAGEFTIWVSTFVSPQYDLVFAPRDGNTAASGKVYKEIDLFKYNVTTHTLNIWLPELLGSVTGQIVTADGEALSYPFGEQKGYPSAAVFLQPLGVVPRDNPLGDMELQSDADGRFELIGIATGAYTLRAVSLGYTVRSATVTVSLGGTCISTATGLCATTLTLERGAVVTGRILKPSGSAPDENDVGGIAATNRGFTEFVMGSVEINPADKTVNSYTISGFKPGVSYDIVILPKEGSEITFPTEGQDVSFTLDEATTTKNINLTFNAARPDCEASAKSIANGQQFQVKIICSKPLRSQTAADSDLDQVLRVSSATSLGENLDGIDGDGTLLGGDKRIDSSRRQITAIYRVAGSTESRFSLKLEAFTQAIDPATGLNFTVSRIYDFRTGHEAVANSNVNNMQGGTLQLEPTDDDLNLGRDEKFRADIPPGAFQTDGEYSTGLEPGATTQTNIEVRRGRDRDSVTTQYRARGLAVPAGLAASASAKAYAPELFQAMTAYKSLAASGPSAMSAFYDIFLPRGIRSQLKKPVDLTLSYSLAGSTVTDISNLNVWYFAGLAATTCPGGGKPSGGYCLETGNKRIDTVNRTVTVSVNHFSVYVVLAGAPVAASDNPYSGDEIEAFNFPNPSDCTMHTKTLNAVLFLAAPTLTFEGTMIHYGLPSGDRAELSIKIYNVAGELVREMSQGALAGAKTYYTPWDCRNNSGRTVASGVYIGQIKWGDKNKFFKMAIIKGSGL